MKNRMHKLFGISLLLSISFPIYAQNPLPLFTKYTAKEYRSHSVNMDMTCDTLGNVFSANFEGLLIYDGATFKTLHTPGISSLTNVHKDNQGRVWAMGSNYLGFCTKDGMNNPWVLHTVISDVNGHQTDDAIPAEIQKWREKYANHNSRKIQNETWNGYIVNDRCKLPDGNEFLATNQGVVELSGKDGSMLYNLTEEDGLNTNAVNSISYDGKNSLWGATDDGIFRITLSPALSAFTTKQGLRGDVTSIHRNQGNFYAGTMHGLYLCRGSRFTQVPGIQFVCWELGAAPNGKMYAATANGLYLVSGEEATRISSNHVLSVLFLNSTTYLTGELDGIFQNTINGEHVRLSAIPNITHLWLDEQGTICASNISNQVYRKTASAAHFGDAEQLSVSHQLDFQDSKGIHWFTDSEGKNMQCSQQDCNEWLYSLHNTTIRCIYEDDQFIWLGCSLGLIRFDIAQGIANHPIKPKLMLRSFEQNGRNLSFILATNKYDPLDGYLYSYRTDDDEEWTAWNANNVVTVPALDDGRHVFQARVMDLFGQVSDPVEMEFNIPTPWYRHAFTIFLYFLVFGYIVRYVISYRAKKRMQLMKEQNEMLETLVAERTSELNKAHAELVRKEKEATVGKLTKGLIDRILNPMNYINNFSHLTLGLVKDLKADVEDEEEHMSEDNFEDAMDVLDMMNTNLQKIEAHGQSTTRILKAMEEMLKDRSGVMMPVNLSQLCQQAHEMLFKYFQEPIKKHHITVDWQVDTNEAISNGIAEQLIKCVMSLLGNSVYAIQKRSEMVGANYKPLLRLQLVKDATHCHLHVYDNGVGIEESILDKIFDPFYTNKPTAVAAGVGLYLTREIIETHGGTIRVDSIKDDYTEFIISLPHVTV